MLARLLVAWAVNLAALWVADAIFTSVRIDGFWSFLIGSAVLGVANGILKPVLKLVTLPLILLTLGLFILLINVAMVALAEWAAPHFSIDGFWTYIGTVVIVWLVNWVAYAVLDEVQKPRAKYA